MAKVIRKLSDKAMFFEKKNQIWDQVIALLIFFKCVNIGRIWLALFSCLKILKIIIIANFENESISQKGF